MVEMVAIVLFATILAILTVTTSKIPERMSNRWITEKKKDEESWRQLWEE